MTYDLELLSLFISHQNDQEEDMSVFRVWKSEWDLMKLNEKEHPMATRNLITHKVDNSNTARYGRSSVPYMQNLLNQTS